MDFLDPKKQKRQRTNLMILYGLIAIAIGFVMYFLIYATIGYGVDKSGHIIQNGFVFVSSQPSGAKVDVVGKPYAATTNARLTLPSGSYQLKITDTGYRDWARQITVQGGDIQRFNYPFLFPSNLQTKATASYSTTPLFTSQSPDHRWLLVKPAEDTASILQYDLNDPTSTPITNLNLPSGIYTTGGQNDTWVATEWSTDNKHVLLLHTFTLDGTTSQEYLMLDRTDPTSTVNVTRQLSLTAADSVSLFNKKYNQYYVFDKTTGVLRTTSLDSSIDPEQLEHIVAFKSYGNDTLLYATTTPPTGKAVDGKLSVVLQQGQKTYTLRTIPSGAIAYSLDVTQYNGDWYVVVGSPATDGVYLYRNPQDQTLTSNTYPAAWRYFRLDDVTRVNFSSTAQFLLVESGQQFIVYDAENVRTYHYTTTQQLDSPQVYALWMDGSHLTYISGGKQIVFDYDYQNVQKLQSASAAYTPSFDPNYTALYTLDPATAGVDHVSLEKTLLTVK